MLKTKIIVISILSSIIILSGIISAAQIGISPSQANFKNVLRGGYSERTITISTNSETTNFVEIIPRGEILKWLNFSETNFEISKDNPHILKISVSPPEDMPNGNYTGYLRVKTNPENKNTRINHATSNILPVVDLFVNVEVTDQEYFECMAGSFEVESVEEGEDIIFKANVRNMGNTRINPEIRINIWDSNQIQIIKSETFSEITVIPTTEEEITINVESLDLKIDQYWVDISAIDCYASQTLTFDILEEGSLKANGFLNKIITSPWIYSGDTTLIEAIFINDGEKSVGASFKGKITSGDRTIQLIESEKINVPISEEEIFQFYFTPQIPGKYIVSGRVYYDNKKTFEKSAIINVQQSGINLKTIGKLAIYIILFSGILFLLYKINKEKRIYKMRLKELGK